MTQRRDIIEMTDGRLIGDSKYQKNTSIFNGDIHMFDNAGTYTLLIALSSILDESYYQYLFYDSIR
jgi:hypothetical protein